jgi:hypothetical protein
MVASLALLEYKYSSIFLQGSPLPNTHSSSSKSPLPDLKPQELHFRPFNASNSTPNIFLGDPSPSTAQLSHNIKLILVQDQSESKDIPSRF